MNAIRAAWDRIWFRRFDPLSVSVFRIFLGTLLTVGYLALYPNFTEYYAADGRVSLNEPALEWPTQEWPSWFFLRMTIHPEFRASLFYWTEWLFPVQVYWWIALLAAVGFTVGYQTRLCTILLFLIEISMSHTNRMMVNGENNTYAFLLFYACFAPLNYTLSLDSWLKKRRTAVTGPAGEADYPMIWPVRLMQINIALIYVFSLPHKLAFADWRNGEAIYWSLLNDTWSRWPWPEYLYRGVGPLLCTFATMGPVLVEGAFPILVWFRSTRLYVLAAAASMHLLLALLLQNMAFFTLCMVCAFWVFVPAETTRQIGRAFARCWRFLTRQPAPPEPEALHAQSEIG